MADFRTLRQSGHFWDNTKGIPGLLQIRRGYSMHSTAGRGASTLLSLLRYYADRNLADPALFAGLSMTEDPHFQKHLGTYRVFLLDLSDYHCTSVEDTVAYLYGKAEALYRAHADLYYPDIDINLARTAIAVHSRTLDTPALCASFPKLFEEGRYRGHKTMLLIDNPVLLEVAAEQADGHTGSTLRKLLKELLPSTLGSACDKLVIANALPYQDPWDDCDYRYTCCNFDLFPDEMEDAPSHRTFQGVPREHRYAVADPPPQPVLPPAPYETWDAFFDDLSHLADEEEARRARRAAQQAEQERRRYLLPPPKDFPQISPHLGARRFTAPTDTPQYEARNQHLRDLYRLHCKDSYDLYEAMQKVDERKHTDVPHANHSEDPLRDAFRPFTEARGWDIQTYHSDYWLQYNFYPPGEDKNNTGEYVKIYLSFPGRAVRQPFQQLTTHLIQGAQKDFVIKVSRFLRDDNVCCWVRPPDLPLLKDYALQHAQELTQPLPFVPYWNGIGLTRELPDSYNRALSEILFDYFSTVPDADHVSLLDMLDGYARAWNTNNPSDHFKHNGLTFLLVLDSFSVILGDLRPEDSFLLLYDKAAWEKLRDAHCWDDLSERR